MYTYSYTYEHAYMCIHTYVYMNMYIYISKNKYTLFYTQMLRKISKRRNVLHPYFKIN